MKITETQLKIAEDILVNDSYIHDSDLALIGCYIDSWNYTSKQQKQRKKQAAYQVLINAIKYGIKE